MVLSSYDLMDVDSVANGLVVVGVGVLRLDFLGLVLL